MEEEFFISGFCKAQNQGRTIILVVETAEGEKTLVEVNCGYGSCQHEDSCQIAAQIREHLD